MVMFRMMNWNLKQFGTFQEALDEAVQLGQRQFTVTLDRKLGEMTFQVEEALGMEADLAAQFAAHPQPQFGENKEGPEP